MNGLSVPVLAGMGCFSLLAMAGGCLLYVEQRNKQVAQQMARVLKPYGSNTATPVVRQSRLARSSVQLGWADRLGGIVGLQVNRPDLYPVSWWIVPLVMVLVSFMLTQAIMAMTGPLGWLAWPVLWLICTRWMFGHWRAKYRKALLRQLPDALAMIVRSVRTGMPVTDAFRIVAQEAPLLTAREFRVMHGELSVGVMLDDALWKLAMRTGLREYRFIAVALALQAQTGGNLTETLDNLAEVMRKRAALRQRGHALSSEGRATAVVLTALPFLTGGALYVIAPDYIRVLFIDPLGKRIFIAVIVFLTLGLITIRSMINRSLA